MDDADDLTSAATLSTYEHHADRYIQRTSTDRSALVDDLIRLTSPGAVVLELGSGPGRDALALEAAGLIVHRTDGAESFVERFHRDGFQARVLNVLAEDFGGPFDAIFANAVLLHVPRAQLTSVLATAFRATRVGGVLVASFKKGVGDEWSTRKLEAPRHFTYWQEDELQQVALVAGWTSLNVIEATQPRSVEQWITVAARKSARPTD
jgi:SAM-dependent methyltransferase